MNNREIDMLIVGFSVGALVFLWVGYRLRVHVERWHARRSANKKVHDWEKARPSIPKYITDIKTHREQSAHQVLAKRPRFIPLVPRSTDLSVEYEHYAKNDAKLAAELCVRATRTEVIATLSGAGFKRSEAITAVDSCTLAERDAGLEAWVGAALRRAASCHKP
jgi:hypothetical protein